MHSRRFVLFLFAVGGGLALFAVRGRGAPLEIPNRTDAARPAGVDWPAYAGDGGSLRYSSLADITPENVASLEPAWSWETGETGVLAEATGDSVFPGKFEATPLAFNDTLFLSTPFNRVVALDGITGAPLWTFDPHAERLGVIADDRGGFVHRGVASWTDGTRRRILHASRGTLYALDSRTGRPDPAFGSAGSVSLTTDLRWAVDGQHYGNTSPPAVYGDIVIVGSMVGDRVSYDRDPPGDVQAFDARTGRRIWRWDPVPPVGAPERATWGGRSAEHTGHANVWSAITIDMTRGLVYLPVSAASNDFYGGNRLGDNLYTQSLVCLDARTGKLVWARQLVHHDVWDYDPASPPVLTTTMRNGMARDEVILAGKTGYLYAFDRVTGAPVWPMVERAAPASDVPGETTAATQPHPSWPLPFARQGFSRTDVTDLSPDLHARALALVDSFRPGPMFAPPSVVGTIQMPGWIGGAGWGSTTVDPRRGLAFIKSTNAPVLARLRHTDDGNRFTIDPDVDPMHPLNVILRESRPWVWPRSPETLVPIVKPPYGTLTAIDLATGVHKWSIVLGDSPNIRQHSALRQFALPALGVAGAPGGVSTASGLIFITGGGETLYAIHSESGRVLWSHALGAMGYSNPMTFRASDGRQYVVVATGSGDHASLRAFTIPRTAKGTQ